jgi:hypothetical protein
MLQRVTLFEEISHDSAGIFPEFRRTIFLTGIRPQGSTYNRSAGCQRPPCPPEMKRGDVTVPYGLLLASMFADLFDGQINLD